MASRFWPLLLGYFLFLASVFVVSAWKGAPLHKLAGGWFITLFVVLYIALELFGLAMETKKDNEGY